MSWKIFEGPRTLQTGNTEGRPVRWAVAEGVALLGLSGLMLIVLWRLALSDLIIGRGDLFFYFYPYRDFASGAVRAGRVPLWNPYLFMGVPFLANSQAGFFYPLNLALASLPVARMVNASIVLHAGLAVSGAYLWGRTALGLSRSGAWLTGLCYGLGGYFLAQLEHLNQVQVLAWLPWLLWLYSWRPRIGASTLFQRWRALRFVGLAVLIALQILAGHTQSVFICLVGLAGYAVLPVLWDVIRRRTGWSGLAWPLGVVAGAALCGGALAAVQLLPTFELSRLSIRSGGLPYNEAVSFSLRPGLVGRALLPSWGAPLFPEFIAHVGVVGLGLALLGALDVWRGGAPLASTGSVDVQLPGPTQRCRLARRGALVLAVLGLFLALGGFNPLYFLLVKLVPGFGLFRAPARWLALYAIGVSGLAGMGLDRLAEHAPRWPRRDWTGLWVVGGGVLAALVLLGQLLGGDREPDLAPSLAFGSLIGWVLAACSLGAAILLTRPSHGSRTRRLATALPMVLVILELFGASHFLPFNRATAPGALTSLRPAVAHLLGEADASAPGPAGRFLSISDIFFDPGDKEDIEVALGPHLSTDALYDYIIATKQKEVLIPNLPLYYRLPTVDGYDGGVLPLSRYVALERLYMPDEEIAIDGRLREYLDAVPDGRWLSLFNVRFVITDKVADAWSDGVFYDLQMTARLGAAVEASVGAVPPLASTALGVVYRAQTAGDGTPLADFEVTMADGQQVRLELVARATHTPLLIGGAETGDREARLSWGGAKTPSAITVHGRWDAGQVDIRGLSLIDERTDVFRSLVLSDSGRYRLVHSGDVKIYENLDALPRAFFVSQAVVAPDDETALAIMQDPDFDPGTVVVLSESTLPSKSPITSSAFSQASSESAHRSAVKVLTYEPEHIVATVAAPTDGWVLLSDAWFPGWEATVDGQPTRVERADILFRAVPVPAGEHRIEWIYRPTSFRLGAAISLSALGLLLIASVWGFMVPRFRARG